MAGFIYFTIMPGGTTIEGFLLFYAGISFLAMFYWLISFIYSKRRNYLILIATAATAVIYYLNGFGVTIHSPKPDLIFLAFITLTFYLLASGLNRFKKNLSSFTFYVFVVITVSTFLFQVLSPLFFRWQIAVTISLLLSVSGTIGVSCLFVYLWLAKLRSTARFAFFAYLPSMIGFIIFAFSQIKIFPPELRILGPVGGIIFMLLLFYGMVTYVIALRKKERKNT